MQSRFLIITILIFAFSTSNISYAEGYQHINDLFDLRSAISDQGQSLPDSIKKAAGNDLRTLERIFELNTSSLTTIEAYFRLFKMALTAQEELTGETIDILNEWLSFIKNQCSYDIEYLQEALLETENEEVISHINTAKDNIEKLSKIADTGISENKETF